MSKYAIVLINVEMLWQTVNVRQIKQIQTEYKSKKIQAHG